MTHKVGTKVRINCPVSECNGWVGIVAGPLEPCWDDLTGGYMGQVVDFPDRSTYMAQCNKDNDMPAFEPHELIPLDDTYDGNKLGAWDLCPWNPERLPLTVSEVRK